MSITVTLVLVLVATALLICLQFALAPTIAAFKAWYAELVERGLRPELARVTIARRIAAITLAVWKSGEAFDVEKLIRPTA